ncbi:J domain-containing protein [Prauserella muralis]|uniref:J domain-containing protein n=1 Tax=Prauserella muralis TaxID=588067 RepID=A0A2V4B115_9PSEU|nr:J domain-containing protein [Prauserella muralis]PXY27723.1 hypothetical protein BAY60_15155 [Prauserella muralis]
MGPAREDDPYGVLGVSPQAGDEEITDAYHRLVRTAHPDAGGAEPERLAAVVAAYRVLRQRRRRESPREPARTGTDVPVAVRPARPRGPDLVAGPVRYHGPA